MLHRGIWRFLSMECLRLVAKTATLFVAFTSILHFLNHYSSLSVASCSRFVIRYGLVDLVSIAVSSAYSASVVFAVLGMSWVNMLYSIGDNSDPCGTPAVIDFCLERQFSILTWSFLSERYDLMVSTRLFGALSISNLWIRPSCQTLSKALATSRKIAPLACFLLKPSVMYSRGVVGGWC